MADPVLRRLAASIRRSGVLDGMDSILLAVSGGSDSMALLHLISDLSRGRWRILVGHVHHGLRGKAADRDAAFVERHAAAKGLPCVVRRVTVTAGANLEERAREARYRELLDLARRESIACIATGHTRDDQAETVLLRLLRGSGLAGLGGISPARADGVVRPLLELSREELREFLRRSDIRYREDRSNRDLRHLRNRIRRRVIPFLEREIHPGVSAVLARTSEIFREDDAWMGQLSARAAHRLTNQGRLEIAGLQRLPLAEQRRVIRYWLAGVRGDLRQITAAHVEAVRRAAGSDGKQVSLPRGSIRSSGPYLLSELQEPPLAFSKRLPPGLLILPGDWEIRRTDEVDGKSRPGPWCAIFDQGLLKGELRVRTVETGDRIRPLGLGGTRKLQDVFVDKKIPQEERSRWLVVTAGQVIVWVPGLVRSDMAPVTAESAKVVVLEGKHGVAAKKLLC